MTGSSGNGAPFAGGGIGPAPTTLRRNREAPPGSAYGSNGAAADYPSLDPIWGSTAAASRSRRSTPSSDRR
jgi:hypothetical protein